MRTSHLTWLFWLGLIAAVVFLFVLRSGQDDGVEPAWWAAWGPHALLVLLISGSVLYVRTMNRRAGTVDEGARLLERGRYAQALAQFEVQRQTDPGRAATLYNVGVCRLLLWQVEQALADLTSASTHAGATDPLLAPLLAEMIALACALLGRRDEASAYLQSVAPGTLTEARQALVLGISAARSGDFSSARAYLGSFEARQMGGVLGALARAVDALCIERVSGELRHVDRVALFGEAGPEGLRVAWPELVAFVERAPAW